MPTTSSTTDSTSWDRIFGPLAADVATVSNLDWGLWDQLSETWIFATEPRRHPTPPAGFLPDGWLLRIGDNWSHIESAPTAAMVTEVADLVQTAVMDGIGHGWPELYEQGQFIALLTPHATPEGYLSWSVGGRAVFPTGKLEGELKKDER